jgi:hypothetical protein
MAPSVGIVQESVAGLDSEFAMAFHCVTSVDRQIE